MTLPDYLAQLNPNQLKAAQTLQGPLLIQAGAGSGKTKTVIARIHNLIDHGVPAFNILAITFTNKAALELKNRLPQNCQGVTACTIHSFCARLLRQYPHVPPFNRNFTILDTDDQKKIIHLAINDYILQNKIDKAGQKKIKDIKDKMILPFLAFTKTGDINTQRNAKQKYVLSNNLTEYYDLLDSVSKYYDSYCKLHDFMDFDDLLYNAVKLIRQNPKDLDRIQQQYRYISVDEYQDTSAIQEELINLIASTPEENLCVVGDPNQSIYAFRGAKVSNILNFKQKHPKAKIESIMYNYRSTQNILDAANDVIGNNPQNFAGEEHLTAVKPKGELPIIVQNTNDYTEADYVTEQIKHRIANGDKPSDIAVLYRINSLSRLIEKNLVASGIPYTVIGSLAFYNRAEIRDLIAYLRLITNHADDLAFTRIINTPNRSIGTKTIELLETWANFFRNQGKSCSLMTVAENIDKITRPTKYGNKPLTPRMINIFQNFTGLINGFNLDKPGTVYQTLKAIINNGYLDYVQDMDTKNPEQDASRVDNVSQLLNAAQEFDKEHPNLILRQALLGFIESATLGSTQDNQTNPNGQVQLMTIHAAKGLEFNTVFIIGCEYDLFPSAHVHMSNNYRENEKRLQEERRLMYVAITRAKENLYLTYCNVRNIFGQVKPSKRSQFLNEINQKHYMFKRNIRDNQQYGF